MVPLKEVGTAQPGHQKDEQHNDLAQQEWAPSLWMRIAVAVVGETPSFLPAGLARCAMH